MLGYGMEGKATAAYLIKHGIKPVLFDQKPWEKWDKEEKQKIRGMEINFAFGPDCLKELKGFNIVFRSPGIQLSAISNQLSEGCIITSQTKWFFEHCPAKIIGVTGTKGKGTTSSLIYEMLRLDFASKKNKSRVFLTGNIGKEQPLEFLDSLTDDDYVVYELSSFQLQDLTLSPHIGVVLMVTGEHLDYHKNIAEYREAKSAITKFQKPSDFAIINHDFPASMAIGAFGKGKKLYFSKNSKLSEGCFIQDEKIVVHGVLSKKTDVLEIDKLQLKGRHNLENVCAATLAALTAGCGIQSIKKTLKEFKGLEHRLEFVAEKNGILFYNDSFSTTPETAIAAIEAFSEPEILILGGSSKNSDFSTLSQTIQTAKNIKAIILIGQETNKIKDSLNGKIKGEILTGAKNMPEIFSQIKSVAKSGNVVLLSPACASFDMFNNYQDRGEQFKEAVKKL